MSRLVRAIKSIKDPIDTNAALYYLAGLHEKALLMGKRFRVDLTGLLQVDTLYTSKETMNLAGLKIGLDLFELLRKAYITQNEREMPQKSALEILDELSPINLEVIAARIAERAYQASRIRGSLD